jgi:hypothetical protein
MATHGKARDLTIDALRNRKAFKRAGFAMQGIEGKASSTGRLDAEYVKAYQDADVAYTVVSYATPIAWVTSDGKIVIPEDRYSPTTSNHQGLCRVYLDN